MNVYKEAAERIDEYPDDIRAPEKGKYKVIDVRVKGDGSAELYGIVKDGNENDPRLVSHYSVCYSSDEEAANSNLWNFKKGELKKCSSRSMVALKRKGKLDEILASGNVDVSEDPEGDY